MVDQLVNWLTVLPDIQLLKSILKGSDDGKL